MAKTNMIIDNMVDTIVSNKDDDIRIIITDTLLDLPANSELIYDIIDIIRQVSKEIIIPNYVENIDRYTDSLMK
jgi:hypothetical protein